MSENIVGITENNQETDYIDVETAFEIIDREIDRIYAEEERNQETHGNLNIETDSIPRMTLLFLDDEDKKSPWNERVWNMLINSYQNHGGLKSYTSYKDFLRKNHSFIIVVSDNNELLACSTYRHIGNAGLKMTAIGCIQNEDGKTALQEIIKHDVINDKLNYWVEISGAIERYFKRRNGYPMPNIMASGILGIPAGMIKISNQDKVHYDRVIGTDGDWCTKMIFGIKDKETYDKVIQIIDDYEGFMKEVNNIDEESIEKPYTVKQAIYIIENVYRCNEEDGFNEMLPSWHEAMLKSIDTLEAVEYKESYIITYIETAQYMLEKMPVLTLNILDI